MLNPMIFREVVAKLRQPDIDLFASRVNHHIPGFVSWRPEPNAVATDALNLTWNFPSELSTSSIQPDSSVPQKDTERSSRMHFHCTSLEKQTVVSNSSVNVGTTAFTVTSVPISSSTPGNEQDSHLLCPKVFQTSFMESFRQRLQGQGFPQEVSDILLSSWRKSTARQYESFWRLWSGWCDSWQINCFSTSIENILTYLAHLFHEKGLQYCIINVYRSAISASHIPTDVWS